MGTGQVYKNVKVFVGGYDLSGNVNQFAAPYEFEKVSFSAAGKPCPWVKPGIPSLSYSLQGHADSGAGEVEDILTSLQGVEDVPILWAPQTGAAGEVAFFAKAVGLEYLAGGSVGEGYMYSAAGGGQSALVRGMMLEFASKTATGVGTGRNVGAVAAGKSLCAVLQVLGVSGTNPTLDVIVQSDDAVGFASPVTRVTFARATTVGAQYLSAAGPITDGYFRASVTIGGTNSPAFLIALAVGTL